MKNLANFNVDSDTFFDRFFIDFLNDFRWIPTAPTLDPLENFRVNRRLQHLPRILKSFRKCKKKTLKNHSEIHEKSMKKRDNFLIDFWVDF